MNTFVPIEKQLKVKNNEHKFQNFSAQANNQ